MVPTSGSLFLDNLYSARKILQGVIRLCADTFLSHFTIGNLQRESTMGRKLLLLTANNSASTTSHGIPGI